MCRKPSVVSGILKQLDGVVDRSCEPMDCLVFIDENGKSHAFNGPEKPGCCRYRGKIAHSMGNNETLNEDISSWFSSSPNKNFHNICIPVNIPWNEKTLSQLTQDEFRSSWSEGNSMNVFIDWFEKNYLANTTCGYTS